MKRGSVRISTIKVMSMRAFISSSLSLEWTTRGAYIANVVNLLQKPPSTSDARQHSQQIGNFPPNASAQQCASYYEAAHFRATCRQSLAPSRRRKLPLAILHKLFAETSYGHRFCPKLLDREICASVTCNNQV